MKKTFSRLTFAATYIGIVSAAGNLRGDIRGTSLSSQPENVPKAEYGVINFDLFDADNNSESLEQGVRALGSCENDEYQFIAAITTDNKPSDNEWALLSGSGSTLATGDMANWNPGVTTRLRMCLPLGTYVFRVTDSSANGICRSDGCGSVVITLDGVEIGNNENDKSKWGTKDFPVNIGMLTGKAAVTTTTTTSTTSTSSTSTTSTTSNWCEQVRELFPKDQGVSPCQDGEHRVEVDVKVDCFGKETSWKLFDDNGNVVMSLGNEIAAFQQKSVEKCVPEGNYKFTIVDQDGLKNLDHCDKIGYYKVNVNNKELIEGAGFVGSKTHRFSTGTDWTSGMTERDCEWTIAHHVRRERNHEENGKEYRPLKWSDDIYQGAKDWANELLDSCTDNGISHESGIGYSENLAKNHGTKGTPMGSMYSADSIAWRFSEREQQPDMNRWPLNAHHTALNWYASRYFACADAEREIKKDYVCHVQVCRYATAGNCNMSTFKNNGVIDFKRAMMSDSSRCGKQCPEKSSGNEVCYN
mmetsp:Transcript_11911/g.19508  ORF Transcript_11911/g.19508 Transcript_11911/m.19508 type:complete len:527 (-) Transcript_11911:215-1795(-)